MKPKFNLGTLIKNERENAKWAQRKLSIELGLNGPQFISNIERGISGVPQEMIGEIFEALNIPPDRQEVVINVILERYKYFLLEAIQRGRRSVAIRRGQP